MKKIILFLSAAVILFSIQISGYTRINAATKEDLIYKEYNHDYTYELPDSQNGSAAFVDHVNLRYRLFVPPDYYDARKSYPLVIVLHGSGERGIDNESQLSQTTPATVLIQEKYLEKYPCIILAPQCRPDLGWSYYDTMTNAMIDLIDELCSEYSIDTERIYITGLSMGGYGTWELIENYPDKFAAAVPVCGGGNPGMAEAIKDVPIVGREIRRHGRGYGL